MEHTLELDRELEAAFDPEPGKHASFRIIRYGSTLKESLGQVDLIIPLEDILFFDESEQSDCILDHSLDFGI
jgi:hypothetical protein